MHKLSRSFLGCCAVTAKSWPKLTADHPRSYAVDYPSYRGATYDASTTNLTYTLPIPGRELEIVLSFLSPITPTSTLRQSIPASYLNVYVTGNVDLNVYVDLNGQWVSGDRGSQLVWNFDHIKPQRGGLNLKKWQFSRQNELLVSEFADRAEWGTLHFVAPTVIPSPLTGLFTVLCSF